MVGAVRAEAVPWRAPEEPRQQRSGQGRRTRHRPHPARGAASRFAATLLAIAALMLWVGVRQAQLTALGYELVAERRQAAAERAELERVQARLAALRAPQRVDAAARFELGMVQPERVERTEVAVLTPQPRDAGPASVAVLVLEPSGTVRAAGLAAEGALARATRWLYGWLTGTRTAEAHTLRD